ncbi:MAG TPA: hypothetical protein VFE62_03325 [Gemmataceae bacterium]|nr:hypothetical protein [Gemmataceae bacterium]
MANDAKLGLVLGVAIVVVIALVFFRSDTASAEKSGTTTALRKAVPASQVAASPR